jgi:outer membrane receptor protein involved in Fe transport
MSKGNGLLRRIFLGGAAVGAVAIATGSAWSQEALNGPQAVSAPQAPDQTKKAAATGAETVIITGSLIRRPAESAPTPVISITKELIDDSGEQDLSNYLSDIPALQATRVPEDTTGGFVDIGGISLLNLRNLGTQRTLVLVDGLRHVAGVPGGNGVDTGSIPTPLIKRVDIITGGASALYGADAVSGLVNFVMRDDFDGLQFDSAVGQLTQGQKMLNDRVSVVYGKNLLENRLNLYGFGEYQKSQAVYDADLNISWLKNNTRIITVDADPASALNDNVFDALPVAGLRTLNRPAGGILVLANATQPSAASDPDIPFGSCTAANATSTAFASNCFATNPGTAYQFTAGGTPFLSDFGAGRNVGAVNRTTTIGGSGDSLLAVKTNRLPYQEIGRFQVGGNYDLTNNINLFTSLKFINQTNVDVFQPHFANVGIRAFNTASPTYNYTNDLAYTGLTTFNIGLDNAYLDPTLRAKILSNTRPVYNADGSVAVASVADPKAQFRLFSYDLGYRPSVADFHETRFVAGAKGTIDNFYVAKDIDWNVSYTYGELDRHNSEPLTIDSERYAYAADAVVDTAGEVGAAGNIVCRIKLLYKRGQTVKNPNTGVAYAASDPNVTNCTPVRIFGLGGFSDAAKQYILMENKTHEGNVQQDLRATVAGNLFDFWGAGPIGVAAGFETRKEETYAKVTDFGNRTLFGNASSNFPRTNFDVTEFFAEARVPILKDVFLAKSVELSGAYRTSNYSSIGVTEAHSFSGTWRITSDIAFRATEGTSTRAPTLGELYSPPSQDFPNLTDGCSSPVITATADAGIRANRVRNCAALGIPTTYVDPNPTFSNQGLNGSNPLLKPETSESYTLSTIFTPTFAPGLSVVVDYYNIEIANAISTLSAQTLLNLCTDSTTFNASACGVFTRAPAGSSNEYEVVNFIEGPFNFAKLKAQGIDFDAHYGFDLQDLFKIDIGRIDTSIVGNYLIRRQNFTNPTDPSIATDIDTSDNNPRVRLRASATWTKGPLALTWRTDFQTATELVNGRFLGGNDDTRPSNLFTTGNFYQTDFTFRYKLDDRFTFRGGIINAFDAEPSVQAGLADQFDEFGRRYFLGVSANF